MLGPCILVEAASFALKGAVLIIGTRAMHHVMMVLPAS